LPKTNRMMNLKYALSIFALLLLNIQLSAQCVPDSNERFPGIFPDTTQNLDTAFVGSYYEMVMTAIVPKDTLFFGNRIPIDSIGIAKFEGLPAGFTVTANTSSSYWKGGDSGCIVIQGTPSSTDKGVYPLSIQVIAVVAGTPAPYMVPGYKLIIEGGSGFFERDNSNQVVAYPNPFTDETKIRFSSIYSEKMCFRVFDVNGGELYSTDVKTHIGMNEVIFQNNNFPEGLYFYTLRSDNYSMANKFLLKY